MNVTMASQAVAPRQWLPPAEARAGRRSKRSWGQFQLQWRAAGAGLRSREAQRPSAIHFAGPAFKRPWHRPAASPHGVKALRVRAALSLDAARSTAAVDPFSLLSAVPPLRAPSLEEGAMGMTMVESLAVTVEAARGTRRAEEGYPGGVCAASGAPSTPNRLASRLGVLFLSAAAAAAAGTSMPAQAVQAEAVRSEAVQAKTAWAEAVQAEAAATAVTAPEAERQSAEVSWQLPPVAVVAATAVPAVGPGGGSRSPRKQTAQQHVAALEGRMQRMMAWVRQGRRGRAEEMVEAGREGSEGQSTAAQQAEVRTASEIAVASLCFSRFPPSFAIRPSLTIRSTWCHQPSLSGCSPPPSSSLFPSPSPTPQLRRRVAGVVEGRRATRRKQRGGGGGGEGSGGRGAVGLEEEGSGVGGARLREMGGEGVRLSNGPEWLKGVAEQYGMALPAAVGPTRGGAATAAAADPAAAAAAAVVAGRVLAALRQAEHSTRAAPAHPVTPPASTPPPAAAAPESRTQALQAALSPLEQKLVGVGVGEEAEASWQRYEAAVQWTEGRLSALATLALTTATHPPSPALSASRTHLLSSLAFAQKRAAEEEQRVTQLRQHLTNSRTLSQPPSSMSSPPSPLSTALPPFLSTIAQPAPPPLLPTPSSPPALPSSSWLVTHPLVPRSLSLPSRALSYASWCPTEAAHTTQPLAHGSTTLASTHAALSILQQAPVLVEGAGGGEWAREFVAESVARELSKRRTAHGHAA
ncbi:unnamed protein product [Closterium sp. NIES-54]